MKVMMILLIITALAGLWTVMTSVIIRAALGLALTSIMLTIIMFQLGAPLAGVFELSVCAGLISVVFISVISLTHRLSYPEYMSRRANRLRRFIYLPVILIVAAVAMFFAYRPFVIPMALPALFSDVRVILWDVRRLDLLGQIVILLAGVFGVLILFKWSHNDGN